MYVKCVVDYISLELCYLRNDQRKLKLKFFLGMTLRYIGLNWARPYEEEEPFLGGRGGPLCLFHPSNKIICYLSTICMYKRMIFFYFSDPIKCSGQSSMDLIWQETGKVATKICRNSAWVHAIHTHTGV